MTGARARCLRFRALPASPELSWTGCRRALVRSRVGLHARMRNPGPDSPMNRAPRNVNSHALCGRLSARLGHVAKRSGRLCNARLGVVSDQGQSFCNCRPPR